MTLKGTNEVKHLKGEFLDCKGLSFDAVMKKVEAAEPFGAQYCRTEGDTNVVDECTYTITSPKYYTDDIKTLFDAYKSTHAINELYVRASKYEGAQHGGKRKNADDVLIIQSLGEMEYEVNGEVYKLEEGDGLYVPAYTFITPRVLSRRITLEFMWYRGPVYDTI